MKAIIEANYKRLLLDDSSEAIDIKKWLEEDEKWFKLWEIDQIILDQINSKKQKEFEDIKKHLMEEFEHFKMRCIKQAEFVAGQEAEVQVEKDLQWIEAEAKAAKGD